MYILYLHIVKPIYCSMVAWFTSAWFGPTLRIVRYVYDAVWLAAFMFESGLQRLREEFGMELEDIDYSSRNFTQILLEESRRISFRGVSVSFLCTFG